MNRKITILSVVEGGLAATALSVTGVYVEKDTVLATLAAETDGVTASGLITFAAMYALFYHMGTNRIEVKHWTVRLLSVIYSGFVLIGLSFSKNGNWSFVIGTFCQMAVAALVFAGYYLIFVKVLQLLFLFLDKRGAKARAKEPLNFSKTNEESVGENVSDCDVKHVMQPAVVKDRLAVLKSKVRNFFDRHVFLCSLMLILLCWTPWLVVFFPASLPYDGCKAILQGIGEVQLTNQHGWALALFMGALMRIGQHVSDNMGLFVILIAFVCIEVLCYAGVCKVVSGWKLPYIVKILLPLFFGIFPIFGSYAQAIIKDSVFMAVFTLYMAIYIDLTLRGRKKETTRKKTTEKSAKPDIAKTGGNQTHGQLTAVDQTDTKKMMILEIVLLLLLGYIACAVRNNGIYLVLLASVFMIFMFRKGVRRYAVFLVIGVMALYWVHNSVLAEMAGVTSVTERVKLSITFQIAGRYMSEYPDDLTDDEKTALGKLFYGLSSVEEIGELYNPELSDPIKSHFRTVATDEEIDDYMQVIVSMIKQHPGVCIQAVLNQCFGYIYPFYNCEVMGTYQFYMQKTTTDSYEGFDISYTMKLSSRRIMSNYAGLWQKIPGLAQIINPAFPTWVLFFLAGYMAYRKKWLEILMLGAPSLNMAICAVSPVNGLLRYAMPSMACLPLIIFWCMMVKDDLTEGE